MNQAEIGKFIAKCRKEKKLTQAHLAEMLNITDRAVSKWENGKSLPDSSIMLELCKILGITVNELLSGGKIDVESYEKKADENLVAMKRENENNMSKNAIVLILFSVTLLMGIVVCFICNMAISGDLTWSLIPASSIVFAWIITFPVILLGKRGIVAGLISLTAFIVPYLFLLSRLINVREVFSVGAVMAAVSTAFLWIIFAVFKWIGKAGKLIALGVSFLLAIPFTFVVNLLLSKMISEPFLDIWDILSVSILLISAFIAFICAYAMKKKLMK